MNSISSVISVRRIASYWVLLTSIGLLLSACTTSMQSQKPAGFSFIETTIDDIHTAIKDQTVDCEAITHGFLNRIRKYDEISNLNSIIYINPKAIDEAKALDEKFQATKTMHSLHCVPIILKDNFDTADMPTEAGSIALSGSVPSDDAYMVKKLRQADAIIIAKSNMGEWAFSPLNTISSTHGETRNAYDLSRVPAGSSGGTASAIAANFGVIGMGSDTGNSIRGPASHLALVGIRSTIGVTSRDGIVPLLLNRDVGGPLMRTVRDSAKVFNVIAGIDPADATTKSYESHKVDDYTAHLTRDGLTGVRLGVLRQIYDASTADKQILAVFTQTLKDLESSGAIIIDPITIPGFEELIKATGFCSRFRYDINNYLKTLGNGIEIKTLQDVVDQKRFRPENSGAMKWAMSVDADVKPADQNPPCIDVEGDPRRKALLTAVVTTMDSLKLDALIYPTWSNPPRKTEDSESPDGNNSPVIAPHSGQPAITVPMGYVYNNLPVGLQILGRPFSEKKLFQYAYAYEQATHHRKPPLLFP
ncbi:MAG: amidase family protein [Gammaproteobacteria bacterium]|nr:amidase family protein [Gammaproteobacteria bacterium]